MNACFKKDQTVIYNGELFTIHRKLPNDNWQLENNLTRAIETVSIEALNKAYVSGKLRFPDNVVPLSAAKQGRTPRATISRGFDEVDPALQEIAKQRLTYVRAIEAAGLSAFTPRQLKPLIELTHRQLKLGNKVRRPHPSTVLRWRNRYLQGGRHVMSLVPKFETRGPQQPYSNSKVVELVDQAIKEVFMTLERRTYKDTYHRAVALVAEYNKTLPNSANLQLPSKSLLKKRIMSIPSEDRCIAREGRQRAWQKFRGQKGHWVAKSILEYIQIDSTILDLFVIDDVHNLPLGRPYLTASIDVYSRCIHGVYLGFTPPSDLSVAQCLKSGILPKDGLRDEYHGIKYPWRCHGLPETIVVDNGLEYHSDAFDTMCFQLGMSIQYCPRKRPTYKPHIERWFRTLNQGLIHTIPGTTFSNIIERGDYDPKKHAVVTLSELRRLLHKWICDEYHVTPHRTLKDTPDHVWEMGAIGTDILLPPNPQQLDIITGKVAERKAFHYGIELNGLLYNSEDLIELRRFHGEILDVTVRWNAEDLGQIYVCHPNNREYIRVPALRQDYAAGLSVWQHEQIKKLARKRMNGSVVIDALLEAKEALRNFVLNALSRKNVRARKQVARYLEDSGKANSDDSGIVPSDTEASADVKGPGVSTNTPTARPSPASPHVRIPDRSTENSKCTVVLRNRNVGGSI
jgi:putative transposase